MDLIVVQEVVITRSVSKLGVCIIISELTITFLAQCFHSTIYDVNFRLKIFFVVTR